MLLIWRQGRMGRSESRRDVRGLEDLRDLLRVEFGAQVFYIEARGTSGEEPLDSRLRFSPEDLTDEDFRWLTAPVRDEVRGVRL